MEKKPNFIKKHKKLMVWLIIIIIAAVCLIVYIQSQRAAMGALAQTPPEIAALGRMDLESKVTASGNFASIDPVTIGSNVQYAEVETVYVEAGDRVTAGDVLAKLKTSDISRDISDTKDAITDAQKSDKQKLESAQRAFDDANTQYYADLSQNNKAIENAQVKVNEANAARDAAVFAAQSDPANPDLQKAAAEAQAAAAAAQEAYDKAVQQRDNTERSDNTRWYDAKASLDALTGQDSAKKSRTQLESLNEDLQNASIVATISGIVTHVNTEAGKAASGSMFTVENTESLQISATVAEYDVIKVKTGMTAHITSNALGSQSFEGAVDFVAPIAADTNGNFEVRVLLTSPPGDLRPGMTATISIVIESKQNVFAVPIDAVVTKPDGTKVVYAYESVGVSGGGSSQGAQSPPSAGGDNTAIALNFERREIEVQTGVETDYYIEISGEGLTEGMPLLTDPLGKNVAVANSDDQMAMMFGAEPAGPAGGGAVRTERVVSDGGGGSRNAAIGG